MKSLSTTPTRKIIHIDMDCFYAAIEMRDNPALRGKPIAVGGSPEGRGVVATCSYEARQFGVHSAMPMSMALRKCPQLIRVPARLDYYREVSEQIRAIFADYTDQIEPLSLDEAYLEVTGTTHHQGSATLIAQAIRERIVQTQQLTASAGVAPNKFLAKIASDWRKPNGLYVIRPPEVAEFVRTLPVKKIHGVGEVTAKRLHDLGVQTCEQLQLWSMQRLRTEFGKLGERLYDLARGIDERPVCTERPYKSISVEDTFSHDLPDLAACLAELPALFNVFTKRFNQTRKTQAQALTPKSLVVKIRFHDFVLTTVQAPSKVIEQALFIPLIIQAWERGKRPVRLLGIGVQLEEGWKPEQLLLRLQ